MSTAKHTPGRQCVECEGACLRAATIDEAMTALAVSCSLHDQVVACEALSLAAQTRAVQLRAALAKATGSAA